MKKSISAVVLAGGLAFAQAAPASATSGGELSWSLCATTAKDWPAADKVTECAMLEVPLDYANPGGRQIHVAVARQKATDPAKRRGALFYAGGGPGNSLPSFPLWFDAGPLSTLSIDHDIIVVDVRGTGYSDKVRCGFPPPTVLPPLSPLKERLKAKFDDYAVENRECVAHDPDFFENLTSVNIARDFDRLRGVLGEEKVSFYGVSYGTAVGLRYRGLFDDRVRAMWLDSTVAPVLDGLAVERSYDELGEALFVSFAQWLAEHDNEFHFGVSPEAVKASLLALADQLTREPRAGDGLVVLDGDWVHRQLGAHRQAWASVARDIATVRDGGVPHSIAPAPAPVRTAGWDSVPQGGAAYDALMCNEGNDIPDFDRIWTDRTNRVREFPMTGGRVQESLYCAGWPFPARRWEPVRGESPLQLSGHLTEDVTPYAWSVAARDATGGTLLTIRDRAHGSFPRNPCSSKAVDFFRAGALSGGSCAGLD